jgi:two-component system response regulator GlrR
LKDRPIGRRRTDRIVAASSAMQQTLEQATNAARSELAVLVVGSQGTGRGHIARAIHAWSSRANGPLVVLAVGGTPPSQQERELFGTAAPGEASLPGGGDGALAHAAEGSLLIDEIDRLSQAALGRLVRAIQEGTFRRNDGDSESIPLRARILATAESNSPSLDAIPLQKVGVAPLLDRREDVLPLAAHFLAFFAEEEGYKPIGFTPDARRWLVEESWPGNVRELRERIRQAVRLARDGAITAEALMLSVEGDDVPSFKEAKRAFETRYVEGLLRRCSGNISRAARLAKKDRKDFYDVIRRTGVNPAEFRS